MMTMEALVNKLAMWQAERKKVEDLMSNDPNVVECYKRIEELETQIAETRKSMTFLRAGYDTRISEIDDEIKHVSTQIVDAWDGEKKTLKFGVGTLKFRTTGSLMIENDRLVLEGLLAHTSAKDVATNYISGFKKTAVKKFMGVLSLPMGAAWIDQKTTVKLEEEAEQSA